MPTTAATATASTTPTPGPVQLSRFKQLDLALGRGNYRQLAAKTGYTPSHIGRVLQGRTADMTMSCAAKIAAAVEITLDDLWYYVSTNRKKHERRKQMASAVLAKVDAKRLSEGG